MLQIFKELDLAVPADVSVSISSRVFTVKGPAALSPRLAFLPSRTIRTALFDTAEAAAQQHEQHQIQL